MSHPIIIITDHKNLSYIKDPRKLSCQQACWSLFLQDFNIVWKVLPGTKLAPADALSCYNQVDTSSNNVNAAIVPLPAIINALDLTLAHHIQSSSSTNPLVLCTIHVTICLLTHGVFLFSLLCHTHILFGMCS